MADLTTAQEKTYNFLCQIEAKETLSSTGHFDCICRTCGDKIYCHAADTAKMWLWQHAGHKTWINYYGKTKN